MYPPKGRSSLSREAGPDERRVETVRAELPLAAGAREGPAVVGVTLVIDGIRAGDLQRTEDHGQDTCENDPCRFNSWASWAKRASASSDTLSREPVPSTRSPGVPCDQRRVGALPWPAPPAPDPCRIPRLRIVELSQTIDRTPLREIRERTFAELPREIEKDPPRGKRCRHCPAMRRHQREPRGPPTTRRTPAAIANVAERDSPVPADIPEST
jgi:hypothetical protein